MRIDFQKPFSAPPGAREILLVRHGAVDPPGPDGLIAGRSDPDLNVQGFEQTDALVGRLDREPVAAVVATPLRRSLQTAEPIAAGHGLVPAIVPDLSEIYLGEWEGHGIHDRGSRGDPEFQRVMREQRWDLIPGAEGGDEFAARVDAGLEAAAELATDGRVVVVVVHGAVIAEICRRVTGSTPFAFLGSANGSISRVVRMPDLRWMLVSFNETEHLT
ncbi:MAG TPA: histidine phosphatase family protein [Solirubrobacteraceae bacterium]|nr:histidine phosphatase family protein [Solirubrobacteraceae bacterium]